MTGTAWSHRGVVVRQPTALRCSTASCTSASADRSSSASVADKSGETTACESVDASGAHGRCASKVRMRRTPSWISPRGVRMLRCRGSRLARRIGQPAHRLGLAEWAARLSCRCWSFVLTFRFSWDRWLEASRSTGDGEGRRPASDEFGDQPPHHRWGAGVQHAGPLAQRSCKVSHRLARSHRLSLSTRAGPAVMI
jgi:hypothetical protein